MHVQRMPIQRLPMPPRTRKGEVFADAIFRGPSGRVATMRLVVDTGSTYTWIPARLALDLGVKPVDTGTFYLADRRRIRRRVGEVEIEIAGRRGTRFIVFARERDANVIGVDALQGLLLYVDPVDHRLRKRRSAWALSPRAVVAGRPPRLSAVRRPHPSGSIR